MFQMITASFLAVALTAVALPFFVIDPSEEIAQVPFLCATNHFILFLA